MSGLNVKRVAVYWSGLIKEWKNSVISQKRFCEAQQLNLISFRNCRYRLNKQQLKSEFSKPKSESQSKEFALIQPKPEVNSNGKDKQIRLNLPNGLSSEFPIEIDMYGVKKLIEVLMSC